MLRSLCVLLLAILSWSHHVDCAETAAAPWISFIDGSYSGNWRLLGNKVIKWQDKFNPHKQFFYLTYDPKDDYCEITQVTTEPPDAKTLTCLNNRCEVTRDSSESLDAGKLTCRYKFQPDQKDLRIYGLIMPNKAEKNDVIQFPFTSAKSRARKDWHIATMNFTKCRDEILHKSAGGVVGEPTAQTGEVKTMTGPLPFPEIAVVNISSALTSEANGRKSACQVNDPRTEIMCTQFDANGKVLLNGVKYELPTNWNADWLRIHNLKKSGKILLVYGECPNGKCHELRAVRLERDRFIAFVTPKLDLQCEEVETNLTFDFVDVPEGLCYHMVCSVDHYKKDSKTKTESLLQYRRFYAFGDHYN